MTRLPREAFFLDLVRGRRFAIASRPAESPVGMLLFLPPFAEEMNRSRRMAALAAQAFSRHGWLVLQLDHLGCGDSDGDSGSVAWQDWMDDITLGLQWLRSQDDSVPCVLWTLRAGSLLAADWIRRNNSDLPLLMWQPFFKGRDCLSQFYRLKASSDMLGASAARTTVADLRKEIAAGRSVEIAGYALSADVAVGLEAATLQFRPGYVSPIAMFEVKAGSAIEPSPGMTTLARELQGQGTPVRVRAVPGPYFWQSVEVETAPALIAGSLDALDRIAAR